MAFNWDKGNKLNDSSSKFNWDNQDGSVAQSGQQAHEEATTQQGGMFDPIGTISRAAGNIGSGLKEMVSGAGEALNPFNNEDLGQRTQAAGKSLYGLGKAVVTAGTAPLQPVIQETENMLQRTPDVIKNAPQTISHAFQEGVSQVGEGLQKLGQGDYFRGGLRTVSGGINTAFSPLAPVGQLLPPQVGKAIGSSLDYVKNVTGIKGTENEKVFDDMLNIGLTLIPGGAGKAGKLAETPVLRSIADSVSLQQPLLQRITNVMEKPFPNAKSVNTKNLLSQQAQLGGFAQVEKSLSESLLPKIQDYVQQKASAPLTSDTFGSFMSDIATKQEELVRNVVKTNPGMLSTFDRTAEVFSTAKKAFGDASIPASFSNKLQGFNDLLSKGGVTVNDMHSMLDHLDTYLGKPKYEAQKEFLNTAKSAIIGDIQSTLNTTMPKLGQAFSYFDELKNSAQQFIGSDVNTKIQNYMNQGLKEQDAVIKSFSDMQDAIHHVDDMTRTQVESAVWQKILDNSTTDGVLNPREFFTNVKKYSSSPAYALLGDQAKYSVQLFSKLGENLSHGLDAFDEVASKILGKGKEKMGSAVEGTGDLAQATKENAVSKIFGADYEDLLAGYNNPHLVDAYQAGALNPFDRISTFFNDVKERKAGLGKEYETIKQANTPIQLPEKWVDQVLRDKYKLEVTDKGIKVGGESAVLSDAEAKNLYDTVVAFQNANSAQSFFKLRERIDNFANFGEALGKKDNLERISQDLYHKLNELGRPQIKDLEKIDKPISKAFSLLKDPELKNRLFDKKGEIKTKFEGEDVVALLNKSNKSTLKRLEELLPGITEQLKVMKAIESITTLNKINKPGAYQAAARPAITGMIGGAIGGIPGMLLGGTAGYFINPELAMKIATYLGRKKGNGMMKIPQFVEGTAVPIAQDVILPDTAGLVDDAANVVDKSIPERTKQVSYRIKTPPTQNLEEIAKKYDNFDNFIDETFPDGVRILDRQKYRDIWEKANSEMLDAKKTAREIEKNKRKEIKNKTESIENNNEKILEYGMSHRPKKMGVGYDIESEGAIPDFYDHPEYYTYSKDGTYAESIKAIKKMRNKPEMDITIYRASPKNELNKGDWITLSKKYAKQESMTEGVPVQSFKVKAKDIHFAGDDINEFGYFPE